MFVVINQLFWFLTRSVKNDPGNVYKYVEEFMLSNDEGKSQNSGLKTGPIAQLVRAHA